MLSGRPLTEGKRGQRSWARTGGVAISVETFKKRTSMRPKAESGQGLERAKKKAPIKARRKGHRQ